MKNLRRVETLALAGFVLTTGAIAPNASAATSPAKSPAKVSAKPSPHQAPAKVAAKPVSKAPAKPAPKRVAPQRVVKPAAPATYSQILNPQQHSGFPSAARAADGSIVVVFRGGTRHPSSTMSTNSRLYLTRSYNNGATWTKPAQISLRGIAGSAATRNDTYDPGIVIPTSGPLAGRIVLTYTELTATGPRGRMVVSTSAAGTAWGQPIETNYGFPGATHVASPAVQTSANGFVVPGYGSTFSRIESRALGMQWNGSRFVPQFTSTIASASDGRWMDEPNIVQVSGTNLLALIREDNAKSQAVIQMSTSTNGGRSWTPFTSAFNGSGNPHVTRMSNGVLVSTYRHVVGNGANSVPGQTWVGYRYSLNNGKTWSAERHVGVTPPYEMTYASTVQTGAKSFLMVYGVETNGYHSTIQHTQVAGGY